MIAAAAAILLFSVPFLFVVIAEGLVALGLSALAVVPHRLGAVPAGRRRPGADRAVAAEEDHAAGADDQDGQGHRRPGPAIRPRRPATRDPDHADRPTA